MTNKKIPTLTETFNSFMRESRERFPALDGSLLLMDVEAFAAYGTGDVRLTRGTLRDLLFYLGTHGITMQLKREPNHSSCAHHDASGLNIIFFNDAIDPKVAASAAEASHRRNMHLLDHELAHLAIKDGMYEKKDTPEELLGECVADAYALIRHYQRFGTEVECHDKYVSPFARANALILGGDSSHFTTFVLDEINKCRNAIDFNNLDEKKTADVARTFARTYVPSQETVQELKDAFAPVKKLWQKDHDAAVQKLIDITLDPMADAAVFRTGNTWLQRLVASSTITFDGGKSIHIGDDDKKALRRQLQIREAHFTRLAKSTRRRAPPQSWRKLGLNG